LDSFGANKPFQGVTAEKIKKFDLNPTPEGMPRTHGDRPDCGVGSILPMESVIA
jgi:hypothetical protein